jgi:hypothetical protein
VTVRVAEAQDRLGEYRAARDKVDHAVAQVTARRQVDLACRSGCASCCVDGLTVLPVEAHAIVDHLEHEGLTRRPAPPPGGCAFLDGELACTIYDARPFLCRTHGLPLRAPVDVRATAHPLLNVIDDVSWCALNFTTRAPDEEDVVDATRVQALLTTVDARFRTATGADAARVSLRAILDAALESLDDG